MSLLRLHLVFVLIITGCVACGGDNNSTQTSATPEPTQEPLNIAEWRKIDTHFESAITGINYPLHIFLPADYQQPDAQQKTYPVLYATDGQWVFDGFADILERKGFEVILVAIEQGPNDRRAVDYLMPGADDYFDFLTSELLPTIENEYRINTEHRTLSGTSYGGLFTGTALLMDDVSTPRFKNILSFDGAFWRNWSITQQLETERYNANQIMNVTLILTAATGYQGNQQDVTRFENLLKNRNYTGLNIYRRNYDVVHEAVADPSFDDAVDIIFR